MSTEPSCHHVSPLPILQTLRGYTGTMDRPEIHLQTLPNGLTLVAEPMPWLPSVSFNLLMPVGAAGDPEGQEGSTTVLNDWLYRGAGERDARELSNALDDLGVRRGGGAGTEYATLSASLLADALPETLELYADMVRRPRLEDEPFESARTLALQELWSLDDSPTQRLFIALSQGYFASGQGRSAYGTEEGLKALSAERVRQDYARRVAPKGAILSVAGGIEWERLRSQVQDTFGDWQGDGATLPDVEVAPKHTRHIEADTSQTQLGVAFAGVSPGSEDWYKHALATGVLSGGMGSRLFTEVREKRGLVYSVAAVNRAVRGFGYTLGYAGTTPERADETLSVLLNELSGLRKGVSDDELERSRSGLLSSLVMQGESSGARASALARDTFLLGEPRPVSEVKAGVQETSLDEVNLFLAEQPEPDFTVLTLGPKALETAPVSEAKEISL